jgi:hypothetical protein
MSEFAFLFRGREPFTSAEQTQRSMENWRPWFKTLAAEGHIVDPGRPLAPSGKIVASRSASVHDGAFAEAKDVIGGYILVTARDVEHAAELARGCPILDVGGSVEVRPVQQIDP